MGKHLILRASPGRESPEGQTDEPRLIDKAREDIIMYITI
jgi:hypothetical protein